jgi:hypothetical protein
MGQVPFSLPEAATLVRVPAVQIAEPGPDSAGVRRALDEISVDIDLRRGAREVIRELSSLSTTALHDRIAVASDETLDCYLESLREHEGIEVTDGRSAVVASATSTPPEPEAAAESQTTRPTEPSAFNRPRWSRTLRIPPALEPAAATRTSRAQTARSPRRAVALFACSLVTGAVMAAIGFGWSAVAAAPSEAMRTRGASPAQALVEQPTAAEAAAAVEEPTLADEAPEAPATEAKPAAAPAPAVAAAPERSAAPSAAAPIVAPPREAPAPASVPLPSAPIAKAAAAATPIEDATERGVLSIHADPEEAVYLNGRLVGWGPIVRLQVDAHSYEVTVQRDGGEQSQFVDVRAGAESSVRVGRFIK